MPKLGQSQVTIQQFVSSISSDVLIMSLYRSVDVLIMLLYRSVDVLIMLLYRSVYVLIMLLYRSVDVLTMLLYKVLIYYYISTWSIVCSGITRIKYSNV